MRVVPVAWEDPEVRALTAAQQAELRARYDGDTEPGTPPSTGDVAVISPDRRCSGAGRPPADVVGWPP